MGEEILRRNTQQRQVVLEELKKVSSHPTAAELYEITRRRLPKISLGTIYRNLELLAQMGHIRKLEIGGSEARFDGNVTEHYHIRCIRCGRVDDVHDMPAELLKREIKNLNGYEVLGYNLEFVGICPACRSKSELSDVEKPSSEHE